MVRPCFLVIDREFPGSISTRKLVIETAKMNVITAYSGQEAREMIVRFPAVDGVVLDAGIEDIPSTELVRFIKARQPQLSIVAINAPGQPWCEGADYHLDYFDPVRLLALLQSFHPDATAETKAHDQDLQRGS